MSLNRRQFLTATATAAATAGVLLRSGRAAESGTAPAVNPYELVLLGKTGLKVSRIAIGTGVHGGMRQSDHTRMGKEKCEALLKNAYDRGIRLFDMADLYGTHAFIGNALKTVRDKCVFQTKIWTGGGGIPEAERPDADVVVDRFRKELQTDYIDIILIHCQTSAKWTDDQKRQMEILDKLKTKGIIKAHGISAHSLDALQTAAKTDWCDTVNARVNHGGVAMDDTPEKVAPVLKALHDSGKGVCGMKLIGEGKWKDDPAARDKAIAYALGLGSVDVLIVGFEKNEEMDDYEKRVATALKNLKAATATG